MNKEVEEQMEKIHRALGHDGRAKIFLDIRDYHLGTDEVGKLATGAILEPSNGGPRRTTRPGLKTGRGRLRQAAPSCMCECVSPSPLAFSFRTGVFLDTRIRVIGAANEGARLHVPEPDLLTDPLQLRELLR